jgi:MFS family permease
MVASAPLAVVYVLAATAACAVTLTRPVQSALLPSLSRTVEELTAANVVSGWTEGVSIVAGPLLTGALLAAVSPGVVFLLMAAIMVASLALTLRLNPVAAPGPTGSAPGMREELTAGLRAVAAPEPRAVVSILSGNFFLVGSADVLFVMLAFSLLHIGGAGAGFMNAAWGAGGLVAAGAMTGMVGERQLVPALGVGAAAWGAGLALIALLPVLPAAAVLIALAGAGRPFLDVAGRTLLQRLVPAHSLTRAFGLVEGIAMGAMALGTLLVPLLAITLSNRLAFAALGALLPLTLLFLWRPLARANRSTIVPQESITTLRSIPFFAPLSGLAIERLAMALIPVEAPPGITVIREGDPGDRFYVLKRGEVGVTQKGREIRMLSSGSFFGEIALLRDIPRTATVTTLTEVRLFALERGDFLEALTGQSASREAAESVVESQLAEDRRATARS